jgi:hypothetical protein
VGERVVEEEEEVKERERAIKTKTETKTQKGADQYETPRLPPPPP